MAATISWGQPNIGIFKYPAGTSSFEVGKDSLFTKVDTPANGTTSIEVEDGEKHEAEIEGGQIEAVKYDADKYQLVFDIRRAAGRKTLANDKDGVINGTFAFVIQPEDENAPGVLIEAATLKKSPAYSSADGIMDHYVSDVLLPLKGNSVKIGSVSWGTGVSSSGVVTTLASIVSANSMAVGTSAKAAIKVADESYTDTAASQQ